MKIVGDVLVSIDDEDIVDGTLILDSSITRIDEELIFSSILMNVTKIIIPSKMRTVSSKLLQNFTFLKEVVIEKGVVELSQSVFDGCEALKTVSLPSTIKRIGDRCFYRCKSLESIIIPNGVEELPSMLFFDCEKLKEVKFGKNLKVIGYGCFNACVSLNHIELPIGLKRIEGNAFAVSRLENVIIPGGVEIIARSAFQECPYLEQVIIEEGVKVIETNAFSYNQSLENVSLPHSLVSIGYGAFQNCQQLEKIEIYENVESLSLDCFYNCSRLREVKILSNKIKEIPTACFADSTNLREVILPDNIETINYNAFGGCEKLYKINLPKELKKIGGNAFFKCGSLESVIFPEGLVGIDNLAFANCYSLKEVNLPDSLISLGEAVFANCMELTTLKLSKNLRVISKQSFYECKNLKKIIFGNDVYKIEKEAFSKCSSLESVELPATLQKIETGAFAKCTKLSFVSFPLELKYIKEEAFASTGLKNVNIPESLISIGKAAFSYCNDLEEINLGNGLKRIESFAFWGCEALRKIDIPASVKVIANGAFVNCGLLEEVILHEGITLLGEEVFLNCTSLKKISIPKSVRKLERSLFYGCKYLEEVTLYSTTDVSNIDVPSGCVLNIINSQTGKVIKYKTNVNTVFTPGNNDGIVLYDSLLHTYNFFDNDNNWVSVNSLDLEKYNKDQELSYTDYRKLYEWIKIKKFMPHFSVIQNMPLNEIKNFYVNNNAKRWGELVKLANVDLSEEKGAFFKLCYALGLFSQKGVDSQRAYEFIKNEVIPVISLGEYHIKFGGMNVFTNGYNEDFANLFFKYFPKEKEEFLSNDEGNYISAVYNGFNKIYTIYPNKVVNTNTEHDMLTPKMCILATQSISYDDINQDNEEFAANIAKYGYSQEEFERAQELFEEGKNIPKEQITLHIAKDDEDNLVNYELLEKDNPLGVILGDITNCCQTLNGVGKSCLEYGLSQRNSKFMVFSSGQIIMGQSWVWYDETTKKICLDNIEVPNAISKKYLNQEKYREAFLECLRRVVKGFVSEMTSKGLEVKSITVGKGYNDVEDLLSKEFKLMEDQNKLTGYDGYSDATNQYVLYEKKRGK